MIIFIYSLIIIIIDFIILVYSCFQIIFFLLQHSKAVLKEFASTQTEKVNTEDQVKTVRSQGEQTNPSRPDIKIRWEV